MDEFLISTDVDKIIRELRAVGSSGLEFRELRAATGLDSDGLAKWLAVLEEQGSVQIEHHLTKQICYWTGERAAEREEEATGAREGRSTAFEKLRAPPEDEIALTSKPAQEEIEEDADELQKRIFELERTLKEEGVDVEAEESKLAKDVEEQLNAEEEDSEAVSERREAQNISRKGDYKKKEQIAPEEVEQVEKILNAKNEDAMEEEEGGKEREAEMGESRPKFEDEKEEAFSAKEIGGEDEDAAEVEQERPSPVSRLATIRPKKVSMEKSAGDFSSSRNKVTAPRIKIPKAKPIDVSEYIVDMEEATPKMRPDHFQGKLTSHLAAISEQMDKIGKLKLEKEKLLREVYSPLEQKLESEIDVISSRIMERERIILKLREAVAALPDKAASLEAGYSKMRKLGQQAQEQYDQTDTLLEESLSGLADAKEKLGEEAEQVRQQITSQQVRVEELEKGMKSVAVQKDALVAAVDSAHELIMQESAMLRKAQGAVEKLSELQTGINGEVKGLQRNMAGQNRILEEMEKQLTTLAEIERWVDENRKEYAGMISQVEDYAGEADREYLSLREEVEANFVRRYLRELRVSTDNYQFEIEHAQEREAGIDERIAKSKEKLGSMIAEGKKISYLYEMQAREESKSHLEQMKEHESQMLAIRAKGEERSAVQEIIGGIIAKNEAAVGRIEREEGAVLAPRKKKPRMRAKVKMKMKFMKKGKAAKAKKTAKAKKKGKKK
jgi:ABC-type transporter Mla subunit MlaD